MSARWTFSGVLSGLVAGVLFAFAAHVAVVVGLGGLVAGVFALGSLVEVLVVLAGAGADVGVGEFAHERRVPDMTLLQTADRGTDIDQVVRASALICRCGTSSAKRRAGRAVQRTSRRGVVRIPGVTPGACSAAARSLQRRALSTEIDVGNGWEDPPSHALTRRSATFALRLGSEELQQRLVEFCGVADVATMGSTVEDDQVALGDSGVSAQSRTGERDGGVAVAVDDEGRDRDVGEIVAEVRRAE